MLLDIIVSMVGVILLMFGIRTARHHRCSKIVPNHHYVSGGDKSTEAEARSAEHEKKIGKEYERTVVVAPYADKWATGELTDKYPVCPYVTPKGVAMPKGIKYTGITDLKWERHPRHWGQRKLLLTEIDFLTRCGVAASKEPCIVVYAGAADGRHMPIITEMFPQVELHLYDPRPFYKGLDGAPRIRLNPYYGGAGAARLSRPDESTYGWFTDEVAEWYAQRDCVVLANKADAEPTDLSGSGRVAPQKCRTVYFVSDIRTVADKSENGSPAQGEIERNQRAQENWVRVMRPAASMLKWKLPYPKYKSGAPDFSGPTQYKYLAGDIHFQCWAPTASAESRLVVRAPKTKADFPVRKYDVVAYERNFAWYNTVLREHDFSDRMLRDFIPLGNCAVTMREFWTGSGLGEPIIRVPESGTYHLGWDFVYELQILAAAMKKITLEALRERVNRVNEVLISKGAHFDSYLKTYSD